MWGTSNNEVIWLMQHNPARRNRIVQSGELKVLHLYAMFFVFLVLNLEILPIKVVEIMTCYYFVVVLLLTFQFDFL